MMCKMKKSIYFRTNIGVFLLLQSNIFAKKALFFISFPIFGAEKCFLLLLLPIIINKSVLYLICIFFRYGSDSNIKKDIFPPKKGTFFAKDSTVSIYLTNLEIKNNKIFSNTVVICYKKTVILRQIFALSFKNADLHHQKYLS